MVAPEENDIIHRREYEGRSREDAVKLTRIEGDLSSLKDSIADFKGIMNERLNNANAALDKALQSANIALDKASAILNERLEVMNQFRQQINSERGDFVRRDQLDLMLKATRSDIESVRAQIEIEIESVRVQITPLRERTDYNKGRDNTVYSFIAIGIAGFAAIIGVLAVVFH